MSKDIIPTLWVLMALIPTLLLVVVVKGGDALIDYFLDEGILDEFLEDASDFNILCLFRFACVGWLVAFILFCGLMALVSA
jgi:hypothetical protein